MKTPLLKHIGLAGVLITSAVAQDFAIDWFTIDGGGGASAGGDYSLSSVIGQPDSGTMTGGDYSLEGGFLGIAADMETPGLPLLSIERQSGNVRISWPADAEGFILQSSASLVAPISWITVSPAPVVVDGDNTVMTAISVTQNVFYRLNK